MLTVSDAAGKQVRQLDAVGKAGLHRTPWDLREPPAPQAAGRGAAATTRPAAAEGGDENADAPPPGGRGGRGGGGGRGGFGRGAPMVKPGLYTVTLGRLVNGQVTALGQPQTVEVMPLEK